MRSIGGPLWWMGAAISVDDRQNTIKIVHLPRDKDFEVVGETYQAAIEHPVRRAGKGEDVADDIRPAPFNRSNMRRDNLRPPIAVDESQAGNCAALIVRT